LPLYADTISAGRVGLTWDFIDALGGVTVLDAEYSKGLSVFDASELGSPTASRPGGDPEFSKVTWYVARLQSLGRGFSVLLAGTGQATSSNLLSSEEFAFGGEQFGRAYDPSELVGDEGIAGKVELRYTHDFASGLGLTLYGFGESGRVKRTLLLPDELGAPEEDGASSLGLGLRFSFRGWLSGYLEAGEPTDQAVATTGEKKTRVFGGLLFTYRF
jgi:hemolysin activation/secretion protein